MSQYLLTRKEIDVMVQTWERLHDRDEQKESLVAYVAREQAMNGLKWLVEPCTKHTGTMLLPRFSCKECIKNLKGEFKVSSGG